MQEEITGELLKSLTSQALKEIGVAPLGAHTKVLAKIKELVEEVG